MGKTKFNITVYNWEYQGELAQARIKEMACDLTLLHMSSGDSKSVAVRKVSFDLSISTKLVDVLVRDNPTINHVVKSKKGIKKSMESLMYKACL